jgi:hypothetical protein
MTKRPMLAVAMIAAILVNILTPIAFGAPLDSLLKSGLKVLGTKYVIDNFGPKINDFINTLTFNNEKLQDPNAKVKTKVVPIVSMGTGTYIGAVQVSGPEKEVEKVKAVAQVEGKFGLAGETIRINALVHVDNINVLEGVNRISGVGVSAIIDLKL